MVKLIDWAAEMSITSGEFGFPASG